MLNTKHLTKLFTPLFLFGLFVVGMGGVSYAQDVCNPPRNWFQRIQDSFDRNIRETTVNHATSAIVDVAFNATTGTEMSEYMNCLTYVADLYPDIEVRLQSFGCDNTAEDVCQSIVNSYVAVPSDQDLQGAFNFEEFSKGKTAGSLLGLAYRAENSINYEPVPVNMAFFFKDYASKVPVLGNNVFAQDGVDYRHSMINSILSVWKITRNVAYSLMALIMLYVGITIITRKRISQQVVVTVQYALPKVLVALLLIALSYPIGAFITSVSWSLFHSAGRIVNTFAGSVGGLDATLLTGAATTIGSFLMIIMVGLMTSGVGLAVGVGVAILAIILVGLHFYIYIKAFFLYLKMIVGIATAPLEFAISAIPGNDDKLADWFKRMLALGLGIFAMQVTVKFVHLLGVSIVYDQYTTGTIDTPGVIYAAFGLPLVFLFGYGYAIKVPDMIQTYIVGDPKKRR